jgi:hypothetical protein
MAQKPPSRLKKRAVPVTRVAPSGMLGDVGDPQARVLRTMTAKRLTRELKSIRRVIKQV